MPRSIVWAALALVVCTGASLAADEAAPETALAYRGKLAGVGADGTLTVQVERKHVVRTDADSGKVVLNRHGQQILDWKPVSPPAEMTFAVPAMARVTATLPSAPNIQ